MLIVLIILVLSFIVSFWACRSILRPATDVSASDLEMRFKMNKKIASEIKENLSIYISKNDSQKIFFYHDKSLSETLKDFEEKYTLYLSKDIFEYNSGGPLKKNIGNIYHEMGVHLKEMQQLDRQINIHFRQTYFREETG